MKRFFILSFLLLCAAAVNAQPIFDLGLKAGINNSKVSFNVDDYNENSITKMHLGAFGRVGFGRIYVQPEIYFTKKGGEFEGVINTAMDFDYSAVDVPLLLGFRVIDAKVLDVHLMGGPVFGFVTKGDVDEHPNINEEYIKNHYTGLQYGAGVDFLFMTLDFRMEHSGKIYRQEDINGKNRTFMVTLGFKIL